MIIDAYKKVLSSICQTLFFNKKFAVWPKTDFMAQGSLTSLIDAEKNVFDELLPN